MVGKAPKSIDALIRARMRRQQFVNSVLVFLMAGAVIAAAGYYIVGAVDWSRPKPQQAKPRKVEAAPAPPRPVAAPIAPSPSVSVTAPAVVASPPVAVPKPEPPQHAQAKPREVLPARPRIEAAPVPAPPAPSTQPPAPASGPPSALEKPSAAAAKRMLFSIKCFDDLAYEKSARGREYFSGLCKDGHRMKVSCAGAGCRVEYAPPPSHVP